MHICVPQLKLRHSQVFEQVFDSKQASMNLFDIQLLV